MAEILIVDDEQKMRHLLSIILEREGYGVHQAGDGREALEMLTHRLFDMVISDIKMPRMDGLELLNAMKSEKISCPVVFITAFATVDSAVDAMRKGAVDYITKPFESERILLTVERTLRLSEIMTENTELKRQLRKAEGVEDEIIYNSDVMTALMDLASRVAASDSAVLISGESGTGKEFCHGQIHPPQQPPE